MDLKTQGDERHDSIDAAQMSHSATGLSKRSTVGTPSFSLVLGRDPKVCGQGTLSGPGGGGTGRGDSGLATSAASLRLEAGSALCLTESISGV